MKKLLLLVVASLTLSACSGGGGGGGGGTTPTNPTVPTVSSCTDVNATNQGSSLPCICPTGYNVSLNGESCTVTAGSFTYSSTFSSYAPVQADTTACQGIVTTTRTMTCTRNEDSVVVANSLCTADPFPNSTVQSKAGSVPVTPTNTSLTNGVENMTCSAGATTGTRAVTCNSGYHLTGSSLATYNCETDNRVCSVTNGTGVETWNGSSYGSCTLATCNSGYHQNGAVCDSNTRSCSSLPTGASAGTETWGGSSYGSCVVSSCNAGYTLTSGSCVANSASADSLVFDNKSGFQIKDDGTLKAWGLNESGQLGVGSTTNQSSPVTVNLGSGKTAKKVVSNGTSTCAILNDDSVKCWGAGTGYQLGNSSTATITSPPASAIVTNVKDLVAGVNAYCAILNDATLKCWGKNTAGDLGQGTTTSVQTPTAVNLGTGRTVTKLVMTKASNSDNSTSCAQLDDNSLSCWGYNAQGQVGSGSAGTRLSPTAVSLGQTIKDFVLFAGEADEKVTACAILNDSSLKCWGDNTNGQLGTNSSSTSVTSPTAVGVGASRTVKNLYTSPSGVVCAKLDNNSLICWGKNNTSQVGNSSTTNQKLPVTVVASNVKDVYLGRYGSNCAVLTDFSMKCWGYNFYGQLGLGHTTNPVGAPTSVTVGGSGTVKSVNNYIGYTTCITLTDNSLQCAGDNSNGTAGVGSVSTTINSFTTVNFGSNTVVAVKMGGGSTDGSACALLDNGVGQCWGRNDKYQNGSGSTSTYFISPQLLNY